MIKVTLKANEGNNNVSQWLDTHIMYPQQIFMIQEQKASFDPKSGFFANLIFSNGGQVVAKFKDRPEYNAFIKEVFGIIEDVKVA